MRSNEIRKLHQRAYKKYFMRTRKSTMSKPEFKTRTRKAKHLLDEALASYENARTPEEQNRILMELKLS